MTTIKPIKKLDELNDLNLGSKIQVTDPFCIESKKIMTFGGKNNGTYSFLYGSKIDGITELEVKGKDIIFKEGVLYTKSTTIYGLRTYSSRYLEKLNLIQMEN